MPFSTRLLAENYRIVSAILADPLAAFLLVALPVVALIYMALVWHHGGIAVARLRWHLRMRKAVRAEAEVPYSTDQQWLPVVRSRTAVRRLRRRVRTRVRARSRRRSTRTRI